MKNKTKKLDLSAIKRVIVESPYSGDRLANAFYLEQCLSDCVSLGESPYASHKMLTTALDDANSTQRNRGIMSGFAWHRVADYSVAYIDLGVSSGMFWGISIALSCSRLVILRSIRSNRRVQIREFGFGRFLLVRVFNGKKWVKLAFARRSKLADVLCEYAIYTKNEPHTLPTEAR